MIPAWLGIPGLIVGGTLILLATVFLVAFVTSCLKDLMNSIKTGRFEFSLKKMMKGLLVFIVVVILFILVYIGPEYLEQLLGH